MQVSSIHNGRYKSLCFSLGRLLLFCYYWKQTWALGFPMQTRSFVVGQSSIPSTHPRLLPSSRVVGPLELSLWKKRDSNNKTEKDVTERTESSLEINGEELPKNENDELSLEEELQVARRRYADYPFFAYEDQASKRRRRRELKKMKKEKKKKFIRDYKRPGNTTRVLIPDREVTTIDEEEDIGFGEIFSSVTKYLDQTRLVYDRSYAKKDAFEKQNIENPPTVDDLVCPSSSPVDFAWVGFPFRTTVWLSAYFTFPYLSNFIAQFVTDMDPAQLNQITSQFFPGLSILYGTFISLTLSILYSRQKMLQELASNETSMLSLLTRNLLNLFKDDREASLDAAQCSADQIRTLVGSSRGKELMLLIYSDPYARMLQLVQQCEDTAYKMEKLDSKSALIACCRDLLKDLYRLRSDRLSNEGSRLPPTHFLVLNVLTVLILLEYVISILPLVDPISHAVPRECSVSFATLCGVYLLFFNFATDLNNPFQGVYQLRRSSSACHLLETKWLLTNHPYLRGQIDFDEPVFDEDEEVLITTPGLGDFLFETSELFTQADFKNSVDILDC